MEQYFAINKPMKRHGNLIERIADYDNILLAFTKASRGKQASKDVLAFRADFDHNIRQIREGLLAGDPSIGNYNYFTIHDPKERVICAAAFRERVIHHAIMNVCHDLFDRQLISDTYATRRGKGVYAALERAANGAAHHPYMVKLDYRKYFDSIDHEVLKAKLARMFKDRVLLQLFNRIIDSYHTAPGKGVPIGNLTSQYFANHYLSALDHAMKQQLRVPVYVRYMDDVLIMADSREELKVAVAFMTDYSANHLALRLKSPVYRRSEIGLPFLGYVVRPYRLTLSGRSKRRFRSKLADAAKRYAAGEYTEQEYLQHLLPLLAFVQHADSKKFRTSVIGL